MISISQKFFDYLIERYKILFSEFRVKDTDELKSKLSKMAEKTGLELDLKKLNINNADQIENILKGINHQRLSNNPIDIDISVIRKILVLNHTRLKFTTHKKY